MRACLRSSSPRGKRESFISTGRESGCRPPGARRRRRGVARRPLYNRGRKCRAPSGSLLRLKRRVGVRRGSVGGGVHLLGGRGTGGMSAPPPAPRGNRARPWPARSLRGRRHGDARHSVSLGTYANYSGDNWRAAGRRTDKQAATAGRRRTCSRSRRVRAACFTAPSWPQ